MCRNRVVCLAAISCSLLCLIAACSPSVSQSDQQDEKNPFFQKAERMYKSRDYKEAIKYYHKALESDSNNAAAHLKLGLLYENQLQDYAYAIYHYRRYLELRPQAQKAEYVKQFVERSMIGLASSMTNSAVVGAEEINRLRLDNSYLTHEVEFLRTNNRDLEMKLAKLQGSPDETRAPIIVQTNIWVVPVVTNTVPPVVRPIVTNRPPNVTTNNTSIKAPPPPPPPPPPGIDSSKVRTYVVQRSDSLYSIAQKMYGRKDRWRQIYEANKSIVGAPPAYKLRVGDTLTIPKM